MLSLTVELEQEEDGRWIAEVMQLSGVMSYGQTPDEAVRQARSLALQVLAEQVASTEPQSADAIPLPVVTACDEENSLHPERVDPT